MSSSMRRGVVVAASGAVVAGALELAAYPHLPTMVVRHGSLAHPDAWESRHAWLAFTLPFSTLFPLAMLGFVVLVGRYPEGFNAPTPEAKAYWTSPENWPRARAILTDAMGWFTAVMCLCLAAMFILMGGGLEWGIPHGLEFLPVLVLLGEAAVLVIHLYRAFRVPPAGAPQG